MRRTLGVLFFCIHGFAYVTATSSACHFPAHPSPTFKDSSHLPLAELENPQAPAEPTLFIGILSSAHGAERRDVLRTTWLWEFQRAFPNSNYKFVLTNEEAASVDAKEMALYDIMTIDAPTGYYFLLWKTYAIFEHTAKGGFDLLYKTDDDTYTHIPVFKHFLLCTLSQHPGQHLFIGNYSKNAPVMKPGHIHENPEYRNHTGLGEYLPYQPGAGYLMSAAIAKALVGIHQTVGLIWNRLEDVTVGHWVSIMDVVWVDWATAIIVNTKEPPELKVEIDETLCGNLTHLAIIHKLTPRETYIAHKLAHEDCNAIRDAQAAGLISQPELQP